MNAILEKYKGLFDGSLGLLKNYKATLRLKEDSCPKFFRPRPLPFSMKDTVEKEIEKLVVLNVLEPVDHSDWGTPIVPIMKKDGSERVCEDLKVTLNPQLLVEKYPLPRIEYMFSKLQGGQEFTNVNSLLFQRQKDYSSIRV